VIALHYCGPDRRGQARRHDTDHRNDDRPRRRRGDRPARDRGARPARAVRGLRSGPRHRPGRADRRDLRPARHERCRQDHHAGGAGGLRRPQRGQRVGARPGPGDPAHRAADPDGRAVAGGRLRRRADRRGDPAAVAAHGRPGRPPGAAAGALRAGRPPRRRGEQALRWREAPAGPGHGGVGLAGAGRAGRADHRAGPGVPPAHLGRDPGAAGGRPHGRADHALPGGGRGAGRPGRDHARGPGRGVRDAERDRRRAAGHVLRDRARGRGRTGRAAAAARHRRARRRGAPGAHRRPAGRPDHVPDLGGRTRGAAARPAGGPGLARRHLPRIRTEQR
jgi:hypothetical protein